MKVVFDLVPPIRSVRDLGIYLDSGLIDADVLQTDCVQLFCGSATDQSFSRSVSLEVTYCVTARCCHVSIMVVQLWLGTTLTAICPSDKQEALLNIAITQLHMSSAHA